MTPLLLEFPIVKIEIIKGNPDTILFHTNLVPVVEEGNDSPMLVLAVPSGFGEKYIKEVLSIPEEYIEIVNLPNLFPAEG